MNRRGRRGQRDVVWWLAAGALVGLLVWAGLVWAWRA